MKYKVGDEFVFVDNPKHTTWGFAGERCRVVEVRDTSFTFKCYSKSGTYGAAWLQYEDTIPSYINDSPLMKALR